MQSLDFKSSTQTRHKTTCVKVPRKPQLPEWMCQNESASFSRNGTQGARKKSGPELGRSGRGPSVLRSAGAVLVDRHGRQRVQPHLGLTSVRPLDGGEVWGFGVLCFASSCFLVCSFLFFAFFFGGGRWKFGLGLYEYHDVRPDGHRQPSRSQRWGNCKRALIEEGLTGDDGFHAWYFWCGGGGAEAAEFALANRAFKLLLSPPLET